VRGNRTRRTADPVAVRGDSVLVAPGASSAAGCSPGDIVGGYRLVRRLGIGAGCEVFLGIAPSGADDAHDHTVAIKVFHPLVDPDRIGAEIDALSRLRHQHTLRIIDVAVAPTGSPCLVLERLSAGSLSGLIRDGLPLAAGEAVTILAPLASAVDSMHAAGVVHGRLRLSSVLFRDDGAPVIVGFGDATLLESGLPPARLADEEGVLRDRGDLLTLVAAVLARVEGEFAAGDVGGSAAGPAALELADIDPRSDGFGSALAECLFDLAEPRPVRLARAGSAERSVPPARVVTVGAGTRRPPAAEPDVSRESAPPAPRRRHAAASADTGWRTSAGALVRAVHATPSAVAALRSGAVARTLAGHARGVRPRFWIPAALVGVSLAVGLAVVPVEGGGAAGGADRPHPPIADGGVAPGAGAGGGGSADHGESEARDVDTPGTGTPDADVPEPPESPANPADPVTSDDPVAALAALLERRDECIRDVSVLCLDDVAQAGSSALQADAALVRAIQAGGEVPDDGGLVVGELRLVERLGDSALIDLGSSAHSTTASTLVMRGEAGWRIRDYLAADPDG
jgi:hypothetical protein